MVDLAKFKNIFISEVEDQLETLNQYLLKIDKLVAGKKLKEISKDDLNELMRAAHTIKGSSASMGYVKTAFLAHILEDVFDAARNDKLAFNSDIINESFKAIDNLEKTLEAIKKDSVELDFDDFSNNLKKITGVNTTGIGKSVKSETEVPAENIAENKIEPEKEVLDEKPMPETAVGDPAAPDQAQNNTDAKAEKEDEAENEETEDKPGQVNAVNDSSVLKVEHIKVPVKRLDALLDSVEELLIDKMRLEEISLKHVEIKEISNHISLLVSSIQYEIMQARMVPIAQVFARFPRMIRDLATAQDKDIDFIVNVGEIELDRTIVDKLGEPLIHLLRNAVDHGIKKSGKIKLEAIRKSESVVFIVENDGAGINLDDVRKTAVKKGFAKQAEIISYTEERLLDLLFDPNFSTNEIVTEVSGRGVGLSVVKKFAETFSGKVVIENSNSGVRFILELPQTLAIMEALLVLAGENIFAIPFTNIIRSVSVPQGDIKKMGDHDMAMIDGINVPLVDLDNVFMAERGELNEVAVNVSPVIQPENFQKKDTTAVLIKNNDEIAGIIVNGLIGEQEVIVKPFTSILHCIKGFSGSTILGDGKVVLILDVASLLKNVK